MQRLFFSLKFSHAQQQQLLAYQQQVLKLCPEARAVDSTNLHLTLFFLGQVSEEQKQQLLNLTERVAAPRFGLTLDTLSGFAKPKIVYLAPSIIPAELVLLQQQLATLCKAQGFADIHDRYRPHVTLARHAVFSASVAIEPIRLEISEYALYVSENNNGKVQYSPLHIVKLLA